MKPYKAEFFKRDFTLRAAAGIQSPELVFDYLTTEKTEITLPGAVKIARGDWAHVTDMNGAVHQHLCRFHISAFYWQTVRDESGLCDG